MKSRTRSTLITSVVLACLAIPGRADAQTVTYSNGQVNSTPFTTTAPDENLTLSIASGAATQSGVISGDGVVTKIGGGTIALTGNNTYTGGTVVSAGTLAIGGGGATGAVVGNIVNHASLAFNRTDDYTFGGVISGTGGLSNNGNILRLSAAQTYTGPTSVHSGYLVLPTTVDQGVSPSTTFHVATGASIDISNRAQTVAGLSGGGTIYSANGSSGQLTVHTAVDAPSTFSGILGGGFQDLVFADYALVKTGPGTLTLTGANSYTRGTTILDGTLEIGSGGTSGSIIGTVQNHSHLRFNRSNDLSVAGTLSGPGALSKTGSGTLTITGNNTYTGTTHVHEGALSIASASNLGAGAIVVTGGTLSATQSIEFDRAVSVTGSAAALQSQNEIAVGYGLSKTGTLEISNGGMVTSNSSFNIGGLPGSLGVVSVSGAGSRLDAGSFLNIGNFGGSEGRLTIHSGGTVAASVFSFGSSTNSSGTLNLNAGGTVEAGGANGIQQVVGMFNFNLSGGTIKVVGSALSTDVPATLNETSTIDTNGLGATFSGVLSGDGGLIKTGDGTLTLAAENTYTGDTTVEAGVLSLSNPTLDPSSVVHLNGSAILDLNFIGAATVADLYIGGVRQVPGVWSAAASNNDSNLSNQITGSGMLIVSMRTFTFQDFIADHFTPEEIDAGVIVTPEADPDGDGISNLLEYAFDLSPRIANPGAITQGFNSGNLTISYPQRSDDFRQEITYSVEVSSNLVQWYSGESHAEELSSIPVPGTNRRIVTVQALNGHRFMRIMCSYDPIPDDD